MSRRRGEFEHRTSIFEGAFRAWSHLGGLNPEDIERKVVLELDPLDFPLASDERIRNAKPNRDLNADGSRRRLYAYEPLPRSGLSHPYVQAILSPWLGPDADHDAIQLGLTTLRTWWQHRRKGESGSAIAALGTDKMRGVVEGYTRHFFNLAHCLIVNDKEQPPRSLYSKMKDLEKIRNKRNKKRVRDEEATKLAVLAIGNTSLQQQAPFDTNLSPLERLHAEQQRHLLAVGGGMSPKNINSRHLIDMKGQCMPGKLDLVGVVDQINHHATQLAHRGAGLQPMTIGSSSAPPVPIYGDPNKTPVVFVSENGDIQIAMTIDGITCAHCVKIVETVLKGCNGNRSPIDGLLDAAADRVLCKVLIKIDQSGNAKKVAFESARNLAMVGYTAKAFEMDIGSNVGESQVDLGALTAAFDVVATTKPKDVFDWSNVCACPDNGVLREDCPRHSQMNTNIFEAFDEREVEVTKYMAGCGSKYGMPCTCGPTCVCKDCSEHCKEKTQSQQQLMADPGSCCGGKLATEEIDFQAMLPEILEGADQDEMMSQFHSIQVDPDGDSMVKRKSSIIGEPMIVSRNPSLASDLRNSSIISFGNRHMSITSETTFTRAMSGLSALSIDWENMDDFDINVDHSAHINNQGSPLNKSKVVDQDKADGIAAGFAILSNGSCDCGPSCVCADCPVHDTPTPPRQTVARKRSSLRINIPVNPDAGPAQVSFKV